MYCAYPIEQLFWGFFAGAITSWVGASFYFSRPFRYISKSRTDAETVTFTVPNIPGKSVAIFHIPNVCIPQIRETLEPEEEHYYNSEGEEFEMRPNRRESLEETTSAPKFTVTSEKDKARKGIIPGFDYNHDIYNKEPDKKATFFTNGGKYATMAELEEAQKEHLNETKTRRNELDKLADAKILDQLEQDILFLENAKKTYTIPAMFARGKMKEVLKTAISEEQKSGLRLYEDGDDCQKLFESEVSSRNKESSSKSNKETLEKGRISRDEPIAFPAAVRGGYVTLGQIEATHNEYDSFKDSKLSKSEELDIINEFRDIVGMPLSEACVFVASKGYEIQVLYKGTGEKTPASAYSAKLIGVRVSATSLKVTEIIDVGGVDVNNKGVVNL